MNIEKFQGWACAMKDAWAERRGSVSWTHYLANDWSGYRITHLDKPNGDGKHCVVCSEEWHKKNRQRKYCGTTCSTIAFMCLSWNGLRFAAWLRDGGWCVHCGEFTKTSYNGQFWVSFSGEGKVLGNEGILGPVLKELDVPEVQWPKLPRPSPRVPVAEIDHILPIHKGGDPLDLDNLQTLCYSCHRMKTARDLRKQKADAAKEKAPPTLSEGQQLLSRWQ